MKCFFDDLMLDKKQINCIAAGDFMIFGHLLVCTLVLILVLVRFDVAIQEK